MPFYEYFQRSIWEKTEPNKRAFAAPNKNSIARGESNKALIRRGLIKRIKGLKRSPQKCLKSVSADKRTLNYERLSELMVIVPWCIFETLSLRPSII